jgi:hypothetical protein
MRVLIDLTAPPICIQISSNSWAIELLAFEAAGLLLVIKKMKIQGRMKSLYLGFTIPCLLFLRMLLGW